MDGDYDDSSSCDTTVPNSTHFHLPTMKELEECFTNIISGKFLRRRTHSVGTNGHMLCSTKICPTPPTLLKSQSDSKSTKKDAIYNFFCKNTSSNLETIIYQDGVSVNNDHSQKNIVILPLVDDSEFDVHDRIIPEYYISKNGIKVGALQFNFSDSIVDSIRNMRTLSKYQLLYLDNYSHEELKQLILEYNNVIETMIDNMEYNNI